MTDIHMFNFTKIKSTLWCAVYNVKVCVLVFTDANKEGNCFHL